MPKRSILSWAGNTNKISLPAVEPEPEVLVFDVEPLAEEIVNLSDGRPPGESCLREDEEEDKLPTSEFVPVPRINFQYRYLL